MIETWREKYSALLEEVPIEHHYGDEASQDDHEELRWHFDKDELGGKFGAKAFFSRPQVRKNGAPRTASRTVPAWFFNDAAIREFLLIQFPKMQTEHSSIGSANCRCSGCRDLRGALLWDFVIRRLRMNQPAEEIAREWSPAEPQSEPKKVAIKPDVTHTDPEYWEKVLKSYLADDRDVDGDRDHACPEHKPITAEYVRRVLQQIRFVAAGLRTDGRPRREKTSVATA